MSEFNDALGCGDVALDSRASDFDFENIFERFGEATPEDKRLAWEIATTYTREFLMWILPSPLRAGCDAHIRSRVIAAAFVTNPDLLIASANREQRLKRLGLDANEVHKLTRGKAVAEAAQLLATKADDIAVLISAPSLRQIASDLGINAAAISPHCAEFSRRFGIRNRAQSHDWRVNGKIQPEPTAPIEPEQHGEPEDGPRDEGGIDDEDK